MVIDTGGNWTGGTVSWDDLADVPSDLSDGDDDTQLSETAVEDYITNEAIDLAAGSMVGGVAIGTANAFFRQLIHDWRLDVRASVASHVTITQVIGQNQKDVGLCCV